MGLPGEPLAIATGSCFTGQMSFLFTHSHTVNVNIVISCHYQRWFLLYCFQEVRVAIAPLLRGFQAEFDSAAKRTKAADSAFLAVYKKLVHMPGQWLLSSVCTEMIGADYADCCGYYHMYSFIVQHELLKICAEGKAPVSQLACSVNLLHFVVVNHCCA